MMRRKSSPSYGMVLTVLLAVAGPAAAGSADPVVAIPAGKVRGVVEGGLLSWKGVPFAEPPVGAMRWRAPQPAKPWSGVLAAKDYRNDCMQNPVPGDATPTGATPAEDCLYANIWRPAKRTGKLPVIVYIYGGAFVNGGSSAATSAGASLARQGVLFFSFNYRLGRFGTFAHPALTSEDADAGWRGNFGYMDQLAALRWVQSNIAAFGGDPGNVTIMGESAGGVSIINWLTAPVAKGLFHKAVVMSGGDGAFLSDPADLHAQEQIGLAFAASKGIAADDPQALARLRALPAETVTDGLNMYNMRDNNPRTFSTPFVDGRLAVRQGQAFQSGAFVHVPVMIGATSADIGGPSGLMVAGAGRLARTLSEHGSRVYYYRFDYVASAQGKPDAGARHATDVPYFTGNVDLRYGREVKPQDIQMGRVISRYVANFAKTGDPNGKGLPAWTRFKTKTGAMMTFSSANMARLGRDEF